jgi:putative tricarboxylic transport membrane protein
MDKPSRKDTIPYFIVLAIAGALFVEAGSIGSMASGGRAVGPEFWPRLILGLAMCVCVFELIFRWFFDMEGAGGLLSQVEHEMIGDEAEAEPEEYHLGRLATGVGLTLAYVWLLPTLGFAVASLIYIALFIWLGTYRRTGIVAAVSVIGTLVLMFLFMKVVYVSLPLGTGVFETASIALMNLMGIH